MAATSEPIMAMEKSPQLKTPRTDVGEDNDTENDTENQKCDYKECFYFTSLFVNEILLITVVLLGCGWLATSQGGVAWNGIWFDRVNLHGVFMFVGSLFMTGQAVMAYRICAPRRVAKMIHAVLMITSCAFIIIGTYLAYSAKTMYRLRHFTTVHSWLGICVCVLSIMQLLVGFVSFIVLDLLESGAMCRAALLPIHASFGIIIYTVGIATGLTGVNVTVFDLMYFKMQSAEKPLSGSSMARFLAIEWLGVLLTLLVPFMPICLHVYPRSRSLLTSQGAHRPRKNKTQTTNEADLTFD